jgi:hypothetical protein
MRSVPRGEARCDGLAMHRLDPHKCGGGGWVVQYGQTEPMRDL